MRVQPQDFKWEQDELYKMLEVVLREQNFTKLRRETMLRKIKKLSKQDRLPVESMGPDWLYRLCCASLMCHRYHWLGWEWRNPWATELSTKPWIYPRWDGTRCRVLVVAEQGLGDEILFASCYDELSEDVEEAWIEVDHRLIPMFERSFPENLHFVSRWLSNERRIPFTVADYPQNHGNKPIDSFILAANVPKLYRHKVEDFPDGWGYLQPDTERVAYWTQWLSGPGYAVSWAGRQGRVDELYEFCRTGGWDVQYDAEAHMPNSPPIDVRNDIDELAAFMAALGRLLSVPNATAHLAAAIGIPVDVVRPPPIYADDDSAFNNRLMWAWSYDRCDWYPTVRMYRSFYDWNTRRKANAKL